jgi:hypothetical protein
MIPIKPNNNSQKPSINLQHLILVFLGVTVISAAIGIFVSPEVGMSAGFVSFGAIIAYVGWIVRPEEVINNVVRWGIIIFGVLIALLGLLVFLPHALQVMPL